jgi:hypothetical protein
LEEKMISTLLLAVASSGPPTDPDAVAMWIDDLGRLTPFGRTFDVYIQTGFDPDFSYPNGDPRRPYKIGSTYGNESPARSFGWAIEGPVFKNRRPDHLYPWLENCQECIDYWTIDTGIECPAPGAYWDCMQANPYQRWMYLGMNFTPINWVFEGPEGCCPRTADLVDLEYAWCDSWILHGPLGKKYGNSNPQLKYPLVQQQHKDLIDSPVLKFWPPYEDIESERCCSAPSQLDIGDLIRWDADVDWESEKWPGSFHIARFTGPDYFSSAGVVRFACGNDHPCEPSPYSVNYYPDNSCPSDLNEDGLVGFQDLLQVLGDVAAFKYHPQTNNGFNAIVKVLSEWGQCDG